MKENHILFEVSKILADAENRLLKMARKAEREEEWRESTKTAYFAIVHAHADIRAKLALYR
jgi:hypothetical protein